MALEHDTGFEASAEERGFGTMATEALYMPNGELIKAALDADDTVALYRAVHEAGVRTYDTADIYGNGRAEMLLAEALAALGDREDIDVITKGGIGATGRTVRTNLKGVEFKVDGSPKGVNERLDQSTHRMRSILGGHAVRLGYAPHYIDPGVPIEETVGAMAERQAKGDINFIGLSNPTDADTIRRAHAESPLDFIQIEHSLFTHELADELFPAVRELGIKRVIAHSPAGAGVFAEGFDPDSLQADNPFLLRFKNGEVSTDTRNSLGEVRSMARDLGKTSIHVALAWNRQQGVISIPGTRNLARAQANLEALNLPLGPDEMDRLNALPFDSVPLLRKGQVVTPPKAA